jgi:hypothetical protein
MTDILADDYWDDVDHAYQQWKCWYRQPDNTANGMLCRKLAVSALGLCAVHDALLRGERELHP